MGMGAHRVIVLALIAGGAPGCSAIGDGSCDDCGARADGAPSADGGGGGADAAIPLGPFSEPHLIEPLSDPLAGDADPSMTDDALELYFSSNRTGSAGTDIWLSERESVDDPWGDPHPVTALNSGDAELDPEVSFDGLTIYFNSTRVVEGTQGGFDLFYSTRLTRDDDWAPPHLVPNVNSADSDMGAVMNQAGTVLVLHRSGVHDLDLYIAERQSPEADWSMPTRIDGIDTDFQEADPWLSADGLTLYFNSNRTGGSGDSDIYRTSRLTTSSNLFALPDELDEVNSELHEANVALARGGRYLVMSSGRSGDHELWEASR
jgi:hypothetical protein